MTPTPVADAIYGRLGDALGLVRVAVGETRGFDPRTSERNFTISIPHPLGPLFAMSLIHAIEKAAPGITLSFSTRVAAGGDGAWSRGRPHRPVDRLAPLAA